MTEPGVIGVNEERQVSISTKGFASPAATSTYLAPARPDPPASVMVAEAWRWVLYQEVEELLMVIVGGIISILFGGEVHKLVFPTLSVIVTWQVAPLVAPAVQEKEAALMPESVSDELVRVKVLVPTLSAFIQGTGAEGSQMLPQTGAVISILKPTGIGSEQAGVGALSQTRK